MDYQVHPKFLKYLAIVVVANGDACWYRVSVSLHVNIKTKGLGWKVAGIGFEFVFESWRKIWQFEST